MTADKEARTFGATETTEQDAATDWRGLRRAEMLKRVIVAVDGAKGEAEELGDENYVRYVDGVLFPFLEAELEQATEAEREYEEDLAYLIEQHGIPEEGARLRLRDGDLWLLDPIYRFGEEFEGEEGVQLWEETAKLAHGIGEFAANYLDTSNPAATQLISDAQARAQEALRRVRERAEEAAGDPEIVEHHKERARRGY